MKKDSKILPPYIVLIILYIFFIVFAFLTDTPQEIFKGLKRIVLTPDILITDYISLGGIGATLVNAALTSLISIAILIFIGIKPNGSTIMSLWLMTGFSFFGKNIINIWPIMIGVWLFSKYEKEPFLNYSLVLLLSTTLAPTVSQLSFSGHLNSIVGIILGSLVGIFTGFIITPIASHCIKAHSGYNLYNVGFAGGLIATLLMSFYRNIGIDFNSRLVWNKNDNHLMLIFMFIVCLYLLIIGFIYSKNTFNNIKNLNKQPGRLVSDFYLFYKETVYINMSILGVFSTLLILIINGDLNGPTLAGIFTIMGFGCFGKHIRNVTPIIIGALLAGIISIDPLNNPSMQLSILFSTCLAPIAGRFGWIAGIIAGFIHVNLVMNIGYLHGGLNLYNNGLAGGLAAMILIPMLSTLTKEDKNI